MCDKENVDLPMNPDTGLYLQMEDIDESGVSIGGNMFYRPDCLGRVLLDLDSGESGTLFDADYVWEANDLRLIGKGEDIGDILNERHGDTWCYACDNDNENCDCQSHCDS